MGCTQSSSPPVNRVKSASAVTPVPKAEGVASRRGSEALSVATTLVTDTTLKGMRKTYVATPYCRKGASSASLDESVRKATPRYRTETVTSAEESDDGIQYRRRSTGARKGYVATPYSKRNSTASFEDAGYSSDEIQEGTQYRRRSTGTRRRSYVATPYSKRNSTASFEDAGYSSDEIQEGTQRKTLYAATLHGKKVTGKNASTTSFAVSEEEGSQE
eukprot:TRINITY_DN690_c0_g1_i1.p1 TRINITY_DN690_c0_g1~~TRINITY_DN690_c0_g1_i1.p1  ORF type:complete len:237 (+),score=49.29 TRINITY_DN690_c0_g1_i1:63-713(+)